MGAKFTFRDGERVIRFGYGALAEAPALLAERGFDRYALLTTERALTAAPRLREAASVALQVPAGPVPDSAAAVWPKVGGRPLVALGGGRVIDSAKAIGGAEELPVAAVPTTLSGAPFTPFHRMPAGAEEVRLVRPALAVCEPGLMASQPMPALAASAMNALAHAAESLYAPGANPVAELAGLRAAELFAGALDGDEPHRDRLALAAMLAGYAVGTTGLGVHHALCQTIVRAARTPHAETNAVMLPHSLRFMARRAPAELGRLAVALGGERHDPVLAADRAAALAARAGVTRLRELGVERTDLAAIAQTAVEHPVFAGRADMPTEAELLALLEGAL